MQKEFWCDTCNLLGRTTFSCIFMGGKATFSENQQIMLPINMHISSIFLVIHSLWFYQKIFSVKKNKIIKFLKEYQYFDKEGEEGKLHAMVCKILRQQSLPDDNIFSFIKNEVHSQFSSISLFLIITKNIQNIQQHILSVFEVIHFSDFIEKKIYSRDSFLIKYQYFDRVEVKEEYPMKCLLNRQKINQW